MNAKYENFSAINPTLILSIVKDGTVIYSNEAGELLLNEWGTKVGERLPSSIEDIVQRVIFRNSPEKMEVKAYEKVYLVVFHPLPKEECVDIYGFDISGQKEVEEKLRESEEKYRNIVEIANEGIVKTDSESIINYVNKKMLDMLGYTLEEGIGKPIWDFICDEYKPIVKRDLEKKKQGIYESSNLKLICKDGSHLWVHMNSKPNFDKEGKYIGAVSMLTDITKRKEAENALKEAYDTLEEKVKERTAELQKTIDSLKKSEEDLAEVQKMASIGNWQWDLHTDKVYWSNEVYRIFKRSPQESAPNYEEYMNYVHPDDRGLVAEAYNKAMDGKPYGIDHRIVLANGEERAIYKQIKVIFNEENYLIQIKGIIQDITERKKAEEALEKLKKIRIKEIHHRIKNNLQVISSLLDLQADKFEDIMVRQAFSESQNRIYSMSLIHEELYKGNENDKLDFSAYLKKLSENLLNTYSTTCRNIDLRMDLEENAFIDMDIAVPLGIIVNELISNSLKHAFTKQKEGKIRVQLCRDKETSKKMHKSTFSLTISDNGKGIPENLEFESIESLGLQLVSILVGQLDGELKIKRDNGTEFIIRFTVTENISQKSASPLMQL